MMVQGVFFLFKKIIFPLAKGMYMYYITIVLIN